MSFTEYHELKMQRTAVKLQQKAIEMALSGKSNAVMIFALKNLANWADKQEIQNNISEITIKKEDSDLQKRNLAKPLSKLKPLIYQQVKLSM